MKSKSLFSVLSVLAAAGIRTALAHGYVDNATIGGVFYQVCLFFFLCLCLSVSVFLFLCLSFLSFSFLSLCISVSLSVLLLAKKKKERKEKKKKRNLVCARGLTYLTLEI